jgi:hypothetical protein
VLPETEPAQLTLQSLLLLTTHVEVSHATHAHIAHQAIYKPHNEVSHALTCFCCFFRRGFDDPVCPVALVRDAPVRPAVSGQDSKLTRVFSKQKGTDKRASDF